ncbi:MAG: hypothetical protein FJZ13_05780 [Candidatus Omnitrophica bacterium]|nr:hypothetical protein [Candidatus Omnitrophota bacterium]
MRKLTAALLLVILGATGSPAQNSPSALSGKINANNINIRSDSTVSATTICKMNAGDDVEVVRETYDWYKIKLPASAPAFIKRDFAISIDEKTARVLKDNVNIRLRPDEASPILGRVNKNERVAILKDNNGWYKIEPTGNSFGWVHKKFVNLANPARPARKAKH